MKSLLAAALRESAYIGARHGPRWWLRASPGPIGAMAFALGGARRVSLRERLSWVLGREASEREVLASFVEFAHCLAETLGAERHPVELEQPGVEKLRALFSTGEPLILVTAHTGAWELAAGAFATSLDREVVLVMRAEESGGARAVHERLRRQRGVRSLYVGASPFVGLELLSALRGGSVLAFQLDRPAGSGRSFPAQLFGRSFDVPEGPVRLARRAGAALLPVYCARTGFLRYRLEMQDPIRLGSGASSADLAAAAQALASGFENFVRTAPHQWFDFETAPPAKPRARRAPD